MGGEAFVEKMEAATARDADAVQRQRDRNIKKRDEERAKRLTSEKAKKTRLAEAREREQAVIESQESSDGSRQETLRRLAEKRNGRIQQKEAARAKRVLTEDEQAVPKAQYVKSDVLLLKSIFDALDRDRSGTVQVPDLREALKQQQDSLRRVDRHNLADLEPLLLQMERESFHLGGVEFLHLMRVVYPYANQDDLEAFRSWTSCAQILRVSG